MKILTGSICKIGGRDYNQDYLAESVHGDVCCFVVCDGLGSYIGSEVASKLCATKIIDDFNRIFDCDAERAVKRNFCEAYFESAHYHVALYKERNPKISTSCTTAALAVTDGKTTTFAHVGDTRIYFFRNHKLVYQSRDHSLSQLAVDLGHITLSDIRRHKDQNKLTKVLGSGYYNAPNIESVLQPLAPGDSIILCTDGFWEYVFEEEMEDCLRLSTNPADAIFKMEKRLLQRAERFNDNYSAIVIMVRD